ncbi:hypothetical protein BDN67DRAFT_982959 [Paxillus ammoniavirescens]|nr:hypothetical protein BDN67DRAFT_982959 [Paxillus ammoniavirescens]
MAKSKLLAISGRCSCSQTTCMIQKILGMVFCAVGSMFWHLSISSYPQARLTKSQKPLALVMHACMGCSAIKSSIAYVGTQAQFALTSAQVFSQTDLVTDSEWFIPLSLTSSMIQRRKRKLINY